MGLCFYEFISFIRMGKRYFVLNFNHSVTFSLSKIKLKINIYNMFFIITIEYNNYIRICNICGFFVFLFLGCQSGNRKFFNRN